MDRWSAFMDLIKDLSKRLIKLHYLNTVIDALLLASSAAVFLEFSDTPLPGHKLTLRAKSAHLGARKGRHLLWLFSRKHTGESGIFNAFR